MSVVRGSYAAIKVPSCAPNSLDQRQDPSLMMSTRMIFQRLTVVSFLLLSASTFALPHHPTGENASSDSDNASCQSFYPDSAILEAIAGTYSLINTTR